ncbi:hypothetical protein D3C85_1815310 [compost metagenome]
MSSVDRITRLKSYDRLPSLFGKMLARLNRIEIELSEPLRLRTIQYLYMPAYIHWWTLQ